jgi:hypothetical protein
VSKIVFLDLETTGLDPHEHEIWEIGAIVRDEWGDETEHVWQIRPDLGKADPKALEIGRFHERFKIPDGYTAMAIFEGDAVHRYGKDEAAISAALLDVQDALRGAHIVGAVPSFDDAFLKAAFRPRSLRVVWHYHLIDVEALAVGYLHGRKHGESTDREWSNAVVDVGLPWNSEELSGAVGVDADRFERHTALGDARWSRAIWDAVTGRADR